MNAPAFGDRVTVDTNNVLRRGVLKYHGAAIELPATRWDGIRRRFEGWMRRSESMFWSPAPKVREGIYLGYRTVSDGSTLWGGAEEGNEYRPYASYRVAVVVFSERENPVYVFPSDLR